MPIRGEGLTGGDGEGEGETAGTSSQDARIVYVLHPNCAVEEM